MTVLAIGDRLDAIEAMRVKFGTSPIEFVYVPDHFVEGHDFVHKMSVAWVQPTIPRRHIVFVDPPSSLLKLLVPRRDRHIVLTDVAGVDKLLAPWKRWMKEHEGAVDIECHGVEPGKAIAFLMAGSIDLGVPRFTKEAASHLVACHPGSMNGLFWPIKLAAATGATEPIAFDVVHDLWPFVVTEGRQYAVKFGDMLSGLGKPSGVFHAARVPESDAIGSLLGLKNTLSARAEKAKNTNKPCIDDEKRVKLAELAHAGMVTGQWGPKAALLIFALACLEETLCQSKSEATPLSPSLTTSRALSHLLNMS